MNKKLINKQNYFAPLTKQQLTTSVITNPTGIRTYSRVFNPNACFLGFTTEGEVVVEMLCSAVFVDNDAGVSVGIKEDNIAEEFNGPLILPPSILWMLVVIGNPAVELVVECLVDPSWSALPSVTLVASIVTPMFWLLIVLSWTLEVMGTPWTKTEKEGYNIVRNFSAEIMVVAKRVKGWEIGCVQLGVEGWVIHFSRASFLFKITDHVKNSTPTHTPIFHLFDTTTTFRMKWKLT